MTALLQRSRKLQGQHGGKPFIVHVFHKSENPDSPLHPSSPGVAFKDFARPEPSKDEIVISKSAHSAFVGTQLEDILRTHNIRRLYVAGLVTDHCVSTTVRMAHDLNVTDWVDETGSRRAGDGVFLVEDATATFNKGKFDAETVHAVHVESLRGEFATVVETKELLET